MNRLLRNGLSSAMFAALCALQLSAAHAAAFTYHGSLEDAGKPAEGAYDLELTLYTSAQGGKAVAGPLLLHKVPVHAGSFSTEADFGPLAKSLEQAWLEVKVRPANSNEFVALSSRAAVEASASALVCPGAWTLDGNAGITAGTGVGQNYLGTADTQPLIIAVNGVQAGRIAPTVDLPYGDANTVILGAAGNQVGAFGGAVVSGGGTALFNNCVGPTFDQPCVNRASGRFATVAGGIGSNATADGATVSGGSRNTAVAYVASIAGGLGNYASGQGATVSGGVSNYATNDRAAVGGGEGNNASGFASTIGGGGSSSAICGPSGDQFCGNLASNPYDTVAGGVDNRSFGGSSSIGGGSGNLANGVYATIAGGNFNTALGQSAFVGGGSNNQAPGFGAAVAGGTFNLASGSYSNVAGGNSNIASGTFSAVGNGNSNNAGGDWSWAGGFEGTTRTPAAAGSPPTCGSNNTCGDFLTFVWSDGSTLPFVSTGPQQFLVKAVGGIGLNTNKPLANKLTVAGPSGAIASVAGAAGSIALFENNASGYVETVVPAANETGVLFSLVGKVADGGVVYNASNNLNGLSLRTNGNVDRMRITSTGATQNTTGVWTTFSDFRLKRDIEAIDHPLDTYLGLHGQSFEYIDPPSAMARPGRRMGFIAQEVEKVLPQWVGEDERGYKMVTPTGFEALSVEALRELRAEKDGEIAVLKGKLDALEARLRKLETAR